PERMNRFARYSFLAQDQPNTTGPERARKSGRRHRSRRSAHLLMEADMRRGAAAYAIGLVAFVGIGAGLVAASMRTGRLPELGNAFPSGPAPGSIDRPVPGATETTGLGNAGPEDGPVSNIANSRVPMQAPATPCSNPDGIGISRTVEIDTTGGPGFGFE